MSFLRVMVVLLCVLVGHPGPLIAQEMSSVEKQLVQTALNRGQLLYSYDRAAWHATDAMLADAEKRGLTSALRQMLGGWVAVGTIQDPKVLFFDKNKSNPRAVFVAQLADGGNRVLSTHFTGGAEDAAIDKETQSRIRARDIALSSVAGSELTRCTKGNWNSVVLPPDRSGGPILVYILSPQETSNRVPYGGHYRIEVSADGAAGPVHAFTKSCIALATSQAKERPVALGVTQLVDPTPTEISVFTMFAAKLPLYVSTSPNGKLWQVETVRGQPLIRVLPDKPKNASSGP